MNLTANWFNNYVVLKPSIHAGKLERLKNSRLNLLYIHCSFPAVYSNFLASAVPTSLNYESPEPMLALLCD